VIADEQDRLIGQRVHDPVGAGFVGRQERVNDAWV
jgi:hypothetical protein